MQRIKQFYKEIFNKNTYFSNRDVINIKNNYNDVYINIVKFPLFKRLRYCKFIYYYRNLDKIIKINNKAYLDMKVNTNNELLDNINGYSLDNYQRKVVYSNEDNTLVIAGAGSGKTLTLIGKVIYLIEEKKIKEEEILYISFTNAVTKTLKEKIKYNIDIYTFHKLALNIIGFHKKTLIASEDYLEYITREYFINDILSKEMKLLILKYFDLNINDIDNNYNELISKKYMYITNLINLIVKFIHLFKSNCYKKEDFSTFYLKSKTIFSKKKRIKNIIFIKITWDIYCLYEDELLSSNMLDFDDLILKATTLVDNYGMYKNYKYIMIDEYQDTSYTRYKFVKSILNKTGAKFLAVGDDFQSIYRFTGCDLDIFVKFKEYFSHPLILKIVNTYRNSQELIDVSGKFVMKNKKQCKKNLLSVKHSNKPIKIVYYYERNYLIKLIQNIYNSQKGLLILGRNNYDIYNYFKDIRIDELGYFRLNDMVLRYLTVHKSKGLEEDNVIIINLEDSIMGFPNKMVDDNILNLVCKRKDKYLYEEERRLFYVALTRTKNNVYLFVNKKNMSVFVKEILNDYYEYIEEIYKM